MNGALDGIRVIDLSRVIAGPHCSMILGDFGADVIKIEKKGEGDMARGYAPYFNGESTYFMTHNRNKRSVTLDFRKPEAHGILMGLLEGADVLVENFRAGTLEKMGLAPEELLKINPRLIITRLSGFGQDGPYKNRVCFDAVGQSISGLMDITGEPDGKPTMVGTYICDFTSGLYGAIGTLAALQARQRTGRGQVVDVSLLDAASSLTHSAVINYYELGEVMKRNGNQDRASYPANFYGTKDGRMAFIHAGQDGAFAGLCKMIGREEVLADPEYRLLAGRCRHIRECDDMVEAWAKTKEMDEILRCCELYGIPAARVNTIEEMVRDEQLLYRKAIRRVEHPAYGTITMNGPVVKMSETEPDIYRVPPALGQHNREVYRELLGLTGEEIERLEEDEVI
ncbi:CaiB/BaiF CoA transferase family protein [Clostridium transplantifaecale]|uniref:CaiB/BaiF CoA transferase family protein n=1 Tax=Clostridium transplantifaecale TaxID=2479838 RepID=UPI0013DE4E64|nr:CoA transferase [Clostridium transplantifaecale]